MSLHFLRIALPFRRASKVLPALSQVAYYSEHGPSSVHPHKGKVFSDEVSMPDELGLAVGKERYELLCKLYGFDDPYCMKPIMEGTGKWDDPYKAYVWEGLEQRLHWCHCANTGGEHHYQMNLQMGIPKRCMCGYWFKLNVREKPDFLKEFEWPEGAGHHH